MSAPGSVSYLESPFWLAILRNGCQCVLETEGRTYKFVPSLLFESGEPPYLTLSASRSFLAQAPQSSTERTAGCLLESVMDWPEAGNGSGAAKVEHSKLERTSNVKESIVRRGP